MTDEQIKSQFAEAGDFVTRTLRCDGNTLHAYYIATPSTSSQTDTAEL